MTVVKISSGIHRLTALTVAGYDLDLERNGTLVISPALEDSLGCAHVGSFWAWTGRTTPMAGGHQK